MQNRTDDARRAFEQVLALDPKASVAANNLAWIYAENGGNLDVAMQLAQTAQAALPDSGETSDTLGWIYLKKEIYGLSITTLRRAVELEPKNPKFHYHLGLAYARSGDKHAGQVDVADRAPAAARLRRRRRCQTDPGDFVRSCRTRPRPLFDPFVEECSEA